MAADVCDKAPGGAPWLLTGWTQIFPSLALKEPLGGGVVVVDNRAELRNRGSMAACRVANRLHHPVQGSPSKAFTLKLSVSTDQHYICVHLTVGPLDTQEQHRTDSQLPGGIPQRELEIPGRTISGLQISDGSLN